MWSKSLNRRLRPGMRRALHTYWRFARGLTLGVRGIVIDGSGRIFLVKHSYADGRHFPGGGVEVGETVRDALDREMFEHGFFSPRALPEDTTLGTRRRLAELLDGASISERW